MSGEATGFFAPWIVLRKERAAAYLAGAAGALRAARLNNLYPDPAALVGSIEVLSLGNREGLYRELDIDRRSGLPVAAEWQRTRRDVASSEALAAALRPPEEPARRASRGPARARLRSQARRRYSNALRGKPTWAAEGHSVLLRRRSPRRLEVRGVVEGIDGGGRAARVTLLFSQETSSPRPLIVAQGDSVAFGADLAALKKICLHGSAAGVFAWLAGRPGIEVQQVSIGSVGPFFFAALRPSPPWAELLRDERELVGSFGLDQAAVDLEADSWQDPLEAPPGRREEGPFRCSRERKFVCSSALREALSRLCRTAGTRNVVYLSAGGGHAR
jgi:hypothetical protein